MKEKKKLIDRIIKPETRVKIGQAAKKGAEVLCTWGPYVAFCTTIAAAWGGWVKADLAEREIEKLKDFKKETIRVVNHNASVSDHTIARVDELERKQEELMEKALDVTEGKEEPKPEEPAA